MDEHTALSEGFRASKPDPILRRAQRILRGTATFEDRYVPNHEELAKLLDMLRSMGCAIAFTTGVWDLFHIGHAKYIEAGKTAAAQMCEAEHIIMVVGVDTDELTKRRKGPTRPIVPEDERCQVLGHLRSVDIITPQYESDSLFKIVCADARIISETTADLPGREKMQRFCLHLINLPPQAETSSTARIRNLAIDGAQDLAKVVTAAIAEYLKSGEVP